MLKRTPARYPAARLFAVEWLICWVRDKLRQWLAGDELAELQRTRAALDAAREVMAEFYDVANVLDHVRDRANGAPAMSLAWLRHGMRQRAALAVAGPQERLRRCLPEQRRIEVVSLAYQLVRAAADVGLNLTIERRAVRPLAMGRCMPLVDVWPVLKRTEPPAAAMKPQDRADAAPAHRREECTSNP